MGRRLAMPNVGSALAICSAISDQSTALDPTYDCAAQQSTALAPSYEGEPQIPVALRVRSYT